MHVTKLPILPPLPTSLKDREHLRDVEKDDQKASEPVARHLNLPNHSNQHMVVCGLSLHQGSTESRKTLEQKIIFQIGTLIPTVLTNAFHSIYSFSCFSRYQAQTNSVAPSFCIQYKPHTTHNSSIRSDDGLTLETSAFESLYGGQFTLSTQLIKPNYLVHNQDWDYFSCSIDFTEGQGLLLEIDSKLIKIKVCVARSLSK